MLKKPALFLLCIFSLQAYGAQPECSCRAADISIESCRICSDQEVSIQGLERILFESIRHYYNTAGFYAGRYRMDRIERFALTEGGNGFFTARVRYLYVPVAGNTALVKNGGWDQRTFLLRLENGKWKVTNMGSYMSARF